MSWFFDRPFAPEEADVLAAGVAEWLRSPELRWLVENVPGRRGAGAAAEPLRWPGGIDERLDEGHADLGRVLGLLGALCEWELPGTVWDYREAGERSLQETLRSEPPVAAEEVAKRAEGLGLRSEGRLRTEPRTFVVLGGRRLAPLNRARTAARAMLRLPPGPLRAVMLCGRRRLEPAEPASEEVRAYAPAAQTERDLMAAAAERAFAGEPAVEVELIEVPDPAPGHRASTYETLRALGEAPGIGEGPLAIVTSPTCRPFQYLEAARALGFGTGRRFELIAHPPAWASPADPGPAQPHVYLQEIRSVIQAACRLSRLAPVGSPAQGG